MESGRAPTVANRIWRGIESYLFSGLPESFGIVEGIVPLLDEVLKGSEHHIDALALEFQKLAIDVEAILGLSSEVVTCVESECVQSVAPIARSLAEITEQFSAERLSLTSGILDVFGTEAVILKHLSNLTRSQVTIAHEMGSLGILARIEGARLGTEGEPFQNMARELRDFSAFVAAGAEDAQRKTADRQRFLLETRRKISQSVQQIRQRSSSIGSALSKAMVAVDYAVNELAQVSNQFRGCINQAAEMISGVVTAVQMRDVTRQQIEHVRATVAGMAPGETSDVRNLNHDRAVAILKVQKMQLESARSSTGAWVEKIDACLEGLFRIGTAEMLGIEAKILEQEQLLVKRLQHLEELDREAKTDDADVEFALAGLSGLMQIVRAHLDRGETARLRLVLLNLNSIVEACHLEGSAAVVLEVANQISRVAGSWSELTAQSGEAIEEALGRSARAELQARMAARATTEKLEKAQSESRSGLARLRQAAEISARHAEKIQNLVARLQGRIAQAKAWANGLREQIRLIGDAIERIDQAELQWQPCDRHSPLPLDLHDLERELSVTYTAELERQVLQAALYGGAMPLNMPAVVSNEIELF